MRFTTKTEYGVICLLHMARSSEARLTIKEMVDQEKYPTAYIEKILRSLRMAGIVTSYQGNQGGYSLAKRPDEITFKAIVDALEGDTFDVFCNPEEKERLICNHSEHCEVKPVWRKTKETIDTLFSTITLRMIADNQVDLLINPTQFVRRVTKEMHLPTAAD